MDEKCIIQLLGMDGVFFVGKKTRYSESIQDAAIFPSMLEAQLYIEKNRLNRIGKIRKIISSVKAEE